MITKTKKSFISILVLLVLVLMPMVVFASSYYSSLSFKGEYDGPVRSYDGNNVGIELTAYCQNLVNASDYFDVQLFRKGLFSTYIGTASFLRNGFGSNTWTSVGSGNYYFAFRKTRDGVVVNSDDVYMFSN